MTEHDKLVAVGGAAPSVHWTEDGVAKSLAEECKHGPLVLAFYPLAFSPVCREDLRRLDEFANKWKARGVRVLTLSVDREVQAKRFLEFLGASALRPVGDPDLKIASQFGVSRSEGVAQRASVVVDTQGRVACAAVHELCFPRGLEALEGCVQELVKPGL